MNELKTFTFENRNVRTLMLDGSPWFVGKDVAEILGYQNPSKALKDHVDEDDKLNNESLSSLGQRGGWLVSESGLYSLILSSKLPTAKKFKRLFDDLKKQIRKREITMNELKIFTFENRNVRTLMIDGNPWFVGKDVAEILGYQNTKDALSVHVDAEDKDLIQRSQFTTFEIPNRGMTVINESGLYSLILSSKLPSAKKFKRWVTSEVLPAIRKNGLYAMDELLDNPDLAIEALTKLKAEREARKALEFENTIQRQQIAELSPKAKYFDVIMDCKDTVPISIIAKDYGMSAKGMNELLHEKGIQYKVGNTWLLIQKWAAEGYTRTKTFPYVNNSGESKCNVQTRWTQEGRYFIYQTLKKDGILPLVERKC